MVGRFIWGSLLIAIGLSIFFPQIWSSQALKAILAAALILAGIRVILGIDDNKKKK
jgi:hypothetical protein